MTGYAASIAKLVSLAPDLKLLLPAHGPPVAEPGQLLELKKALQDIESGSLRFETDVDGSAPVQVRTLFHPDPVERSVGQHLIPDDRGNDGARNQPFVVDAASCRFSCRTCWRP